MEDKSMVGGLNWRRVALTVIACEAADAASALGTGGRDPPVATDPGPAAYELASKSRRDETDSVRCSLFDVPTGRGHSWEITEREVATRVTGERLEEVASATPAP